MGPIPPSLVGRGVRVSCLRAPVLGDCYNFDVAVFDVAAEKYLSRVTGRSASGIHLLSRRLSFGQQKMNLTVAQIWKVCRNCAFDSLFLPSPTAEDVEVASANLMHSGDRPREPLSHIRQVSSDACE